MSTRHWPTCGGSGSGHPDEVVAAAAASPLFADVARHEVCDALSWFDEQSFNAGHRITLEGFRGADFYIITSGAAAVSVDGRTVARLVTGDFFGELGVLGDGLRFATVTAETPLRSVVLPNRRLEELILRHPVMGRNLLREMVRRLPRPSPSGIIRP